MTTSNEHNTAHAVPAVIECPISIGGSGSELASVTPDGDATIHWTAVEQAAKEGNHFLSAMAKLMIAARDVGRAPAPAVPQGEPFGHFRAEPFGWTDCAATDDGAIALYEHPMANPWRDAVIEQLESWHIYVPAIHDNSPRLAIKALVNMECKAALDPAVSSEAAALAAQGVQAHTPAVPQGWKLVPVEPTDAMVDAAHHAGWSRIDIYSAMLAATPAPEPAQEAGLTDEEIEAIAKKHMSTVGDHWSNEEAIRESHAEDFARAIISALRAKESK